MTAMSEEDMKVLGKNISLARRRRGVSQIDLAKQAAVSQVHLSCVEHGKTRVALNIAMRLAKSLDALLMSLCTAPRMAKENQSDLSQSRVRHLTQSFRCAVRNLLRGMISMLRMILLFRHTDLANSCTSTLRLLCRRICSCS